MYFYKYIAIAFLLFFYMYESAWAVQKFGLEFEYAIHGESSIDEVAFELLEVVHSSISDSISDFNVTKKQWEKFKNLNLSHYQYMDSEGRIWEVAPEIVNSQNYDGVELITPPLEEKDLPKLEILRREIKKIKKLKRGIHSSGHITLDVSHLINGNDYREVLNLILFIESRWPELYAYFNPKRLGHMVNYYSVPLALDQNDLLMDLSNLNPNNRKFEDIRKIFLKYQEREIILKGRDGYPMFPWKFRAANYAKLFALNGNQEIKAIELRLDDLDLSDRLGSKIKHLLKLFRKDNSFRIYFENRLDYQLRWYEAENEMVKKFSKEVFSNFAKEIGLSSQQANDLIKQVQKKQSIIEGVERLFSVKSVLSSMNQVSFDLIINFSNNGFDSTNKEKLIFDYPSIKFNGKKIIFSKISTLDQLVEINKNIIIPNEYSIKNIDFKITGLSKNKNHFNRLIEMMKWITTVAAINSESGMNKKQLMITKIEKAKVFTKIRILSNFGLVINFSTWFLSQKQLDTFSQKIIKVHTLASLVEVYAISNMKEQLNESEIDLLNRIERNLSENYFPILTNMRNWRNLYPSERVRLRDETFLFTKEVYEEVKRHDFYMLLHKINTLNLKWVRETDFLNLFIKRALTTQVSNSLSCFKMFN